MRFEDDSRLSPGAVIWATGFSLDHSFVHAPVFDDGGRLVHRRGVTAARGLYFLGLPWQHTRGSALLGWVKDDAEFIAEQIDAFAEVQTTREPENARTEAEPKLRDDIPHTPPVSVA